MFSTARIWMGALLAIVLCTGGCAQSVKLGTVPPVARLAELSIPQASMDDVRAVLGEPQGKGQARMPDFPGIRTTWSYEYTDVKGQKVGMFLLIVFFDQQAYDGYLWFDLRDIPLRAEP